MGRMTSHSNPYQGVDLTGTKLKSIVSGAGGCKRIAVFSGSGRISITCTAGSSSSDNYMVQAFPKTAWGKRFLTATSGGNQSNNIYRVCVSDPTTIVTLNGAPIGTPLINNFYYQIASSGNPNLITSDKPIMVAQYFTSQGACGNGNQPGDPEVIYLSPVEQSISKVLWNATPNFAITQHYFNVIIPNAGTAISSFKLKDAAGNPLATGPFIIHPQDPKYSYLKQQLPAAGVYSIESDSGFNAIAYGYGNAESYGYNAGTNVRDLTQGIILENQYGNENSSVCTFSPFNFAFYYPDSTIGSPGTPPAAIRFDSLSWTLTNTSIIVPNNFPVVQINPTIDSTNIRQGRQVNWYSLPGTYFFNTPGLDTLRLTVYASTDEGCGTQQTYDFEIEITDPPTGSFTWTSNGCLTQPVQFTETTPQAPKTTYQFWWDFGDPASGANNNSTLRNPTHLFMGGPGTYTVKYAGITTSGCLTDTIIHQVTLNDPPVADFTVSASPYCIGVPITFTDNSTASGGAIIGNWRWDFGDGTIINVPNGNPQSHAYASAGTFNVILRVTTTTGCESLDFIIPVTVVPDATITLTSAPGTDNQTVCVNSTIANITYSVGGSGTGGSVSGLPTGVAGVFAGGVITISGTPTLPPGVFNYTVSTTGPCVIPQAMGTITVNPLPTATISGTTAVCLNAPSPIITFTGAGATAPYTFTYNINGGPNQVIVSVGNTATIAAPTNVAGTFVYNLISVQDASSTTCSQAQSGSATVIVNPLPTGTISGTATVCLNDPSPIITFTGAGATAPYTFTYNINGGPNQVIISVGNTATIAAPTDVAGTFVYNLISVQDASSTTCNQPQPGSATVIVNPLPTATISGTATVCLNDPSPIITFTGAGATAPYTFTYNINGGPNQVIVSVGNTATIAAPTNVAGTFVYNLISVQDASSTTCSQPQSGSVTIVVNQLPNANFTFTIPSCETRVITFQDVSVPNAASVVSWSWNFGDR